MEVNPVFCVIFHQVGRINVWGPRSHLIFCRFTSYLKWAMCVDACGACYGCSYPWNIYYSGGVGSDRVKHGDRDMNRYTSVITESGRPAKIYMLDSLLNIIVNVSGACVHRGSVSRSK